MLCMEARYMPKVIRSITYKCLGCARRVEFETTDDKDKDGNWVCPKCGRLYPIKNWIIKKSSGFRVNYKL